MLTTPFRSVLLQWLCVVFFVLPGLPVFYIFPLDSGFWAWLASFALAKPCLWRRVPFGAHGGTATEEEQAEGGSVHPHDSELVMVLVNLLYTLLWWAGYALFASVLVVVYPVVGMLLITTKLLSFPKVQRWWETVFHARVRADWVADDTGADHVDLRLFNVAVLAEVFLESVPQLLLQLYNNEGDVWSPAAILSTTCSAIVIVRYAWLFGIHHFCGGTPWLQVPSLPSRKRATQAAVAL